VASRIWLAVGMLSLATLAACGQEQATSYEEWPVNGKIVGAANGEDDQKKSRNVSGIACDTDTGFPRRCLVIDDEAQAAQTVTMYDGRLVAGNVVPLISNEFAGRALELDGEGVAYADGAFYVIGSHGHPRDRKHRLDPGGDDEEIAAKIKASSQLVRIRLPQSAWDGELGTVRGAQIETSARVREAIRTVGELASSTDKRLDENGLTIEGVAVAGGRLYAGFRGPLLNGKSAVIMSVSLGRLFDQGPLDPEITKLDLGGRGIRDIAYDHGVFTILAGPAADSGGDFAVFDWDGSGAAKIVGVLPAGEDEEKPEGIISLERSEQSQRVLLVYDGAKEGGPRAITFRK
jgi:uncharacterized protein DUF3616